MRNREIVKSRFNTLFPDILEEKRERIFNSIIDLYEMPSRMYHNFDHIVFMFGEMDGYLSNNLGKLDVNDLVILNLAILYHDLFYDINLKDGRNERISSIIFEGHSFELGFTKYIVDRISALINLTYTRNPLLNIESNSVYFRSFGCKYLLIMDLDYAILGQDWNTFLKYDDGIRYEYVCWGGVDLEEFKKGRKVFFEGVLASPRIFLLDYFYILYEESARENIRKLLEIVYS